MFINGGILSLCPTAPLSPLPPSLPDSLLAVWQWLPDVGVLSDLRRPLVRLPAAAHSTTAGHQHHKQGM